MNAILQVENLTKQYADFKLDHVSFSVPKGTIMGLIGENGAGKSTTINAILDLIHKDDGTVTFWGQELSSTKQIKEDVGVVFDGINFYETLTPAKVGKIAGAAYKQWDGHLFQDYLKRFQLPADKEIKSLSKGMKMKLCIAVALSHNPKLLILDEATSGLDPVMRDDILDVFLEFVQDENHAILCSMMIVTTFSFDDSSKWTRYAMIMPVSKKELVAGKFMVLAIFCAIGSLFGLIIGFIGGLITHKIVLDIVGIGELLFLTLVAWVISLIFGSMSIPLVFKFGAEKGRVLLLVSFLIPAGICFGIYQLLTMLGVALTDQIVFILLCCSPLLALAWCYVMYQISYRIFVKQEL